MGCVWPGRRRVDGPEVKQGRRDLTECLQQSKDVHDRRALGDSWLSAKGRRLVPGPEQRRGRKVSPLPRFPLSPLKLGRPNAPSYDQSCSWNAEHPPPPSSSLSLTRMLTQCSCKG